MSRPIEAPQELKGWDNDADEKAIQHLGLYHNAHNKRKFGVGVSIL